MNYCPNCGEQTKPESAYCGNCGYKLQINSEVFNYQMLPSQSHTIKTNNNGIGYYGNAGTILLGNANNPNNKKKKIIVISLISVLILAIIAGSLWFLFLRRTGTNFLNLAWGENKADVEMVIIDEIKSSGAKYTTKSNGTGFSIYTESDPFFGLDNNGSEFITPEFKNNKLHRIGILITSDLDAETTFDKIVSRLKSQFGTPDSNGKRSITYTAVWELNNTTVSVSIDPYLLSGSGSYGDIIFKQN